MDWYKNKIVTRVTRVTCFFLTLIIIEFFYFILGIYQPVTHVTHVTFFLLIAFEKITDMMNSNFLEVDSC